jgi:hypothetical protein
MGDGAGPGIRAGAVSRPRPHVTPHLSAPATPARARPASWAAVNLRAVGTWGFAVGVARLVLLTLAAAGFIAMHGVSATDPGGAHHNPMNVSATIEHAGPSPAEHAGRDTAAQMPTALRLFAPGEDDGHGLMAACLFVLLSVLAGVTLHALLGRGGVGALNRPRPMGGGHRRSRAPPQPIFLTLCVFRL